MQTVHPRGRSRRSRVAGAMVVAVLVLVPVACSGSKGSNPQSLTVDQASLLAGTLYLNHRNGASRFEVNTLDRPGGSALRLVGIVDWTNVAGTADVSSGVPGATLTAVAWRGSTMLERRPVHDGLLLARGAVAPPFLGRQVDRNRRIDQVIAVVAGLATTQPENAVLLQQAEGTAFLRDDELRGTKVEVLRYGTRSVYWVDPATGLLLRFEGNNEKGNQPVVVDFFPGGDTTVSLPAVPQVIMTNVDTDLAGLTDGP